MSKRLDGKVAIVTGGATGIGEAISKRFAKEGAKVIVAGLPEDPVEEVVKEIIKDGGIAMPFSGDISVWEVARSCVKLAIEEYDKLHILINNAGVFV
jgi:NAD(P)-dependent dehydrogenase (short-subunit alcohol dehydrogenase family)